MSNSDLALVTVNFCSTPESATIKSVSLSVGFVRPGSAKTSDNGALVVI